MAQFFWHFDEPLLFLYKHRPPSETHRIAFLSSSLIYVKLCANATQWRKDGFLQIPPTLEKADAEAGAAAKRFVLPNRAPSAAGGITGVCTISL